MEHHRDRFAQAAGEWRDMTFGERIPYEDMARADKERHQKDLDIATRNLNAALVGSVQEHGACHVHICSSVELSACRPSCFDARVFCVVVFVVCFLLGFLLFLVMALSCGRLS